MIKRATEQISRRKVLSLLAVSPILAVACQSLPGFLPVSTPTPSAPRKVRLAYPNLEFPYSSYQVRLQDLAKRVAPERHIDISLVPLDLNVQTFDQLPKAYAAALVAQPRDQIPDLILLDYPILRDVALAGALTDLGTALTEASWYKASDFYGNASDAGRVRGKQVALPLEIAVEFVLFNARTFQSAGVELPRSGWTWQTLREGATRLTTDRSSASLGQWGFFLTVASPSIFSLAWQHGAQVVDQTGTRVDVTEAGTVAALGFLADLVNVQQLAPPVSTDMPQPTSSGWLQAFEAQSQLLVPAVATGHAAMSSTFAPDPIGPLWWKQSDDVQAAPLPAADRTVSLAVPTLLLAIPANAPDPQHSLNALRGLSEASSQYLFLPARRPPGDLHPISVNLKDSDGKAFQDILASVRFLPGDVSAQVHATLHRALVLPVLRGQKDAATAAKDAQSLVDQALAT